MKEYLVPATWFIDSTLAMALALASQDILAHGISMIGKCNDVLYDFLSPDRPYIPLLNMLHTVSVKGSELRSTVYSGAK